MTTHARVPAVQPIAEESEFLAEVDRSIALLGGQHFLRISLFRLDFIGSSATQIGARVRRALMPLGIVGALPDGSLGLLYVGPRPAGQEDMAVERAVAEKLNQEMARWAPSDPRLLSVMAVHRWADEIDCASDLVDEAVFPALLRKAS